MGQNSDVFVVETHHWRGSFIWETLMFIIIEGERDGDSSWKFFDYFFMLPVLSLKYNKNNTCAFKAYHDQSIS